MDVQIASVRTRILFGAALIVASPFIFALTYTLGDHFPTGENYIDYVQVIGMIFAIVSVFIGACGILVGGLSLIVNAVGDAFED